MFFWGKGKKETEGKLNRVLKNPKILEVNLIKDEIVFSFNWTKHLKGLIIALIVTGLIITELYLGIDWWQKDEELRLEELKTKIAEQSKEVNDFRKSADAALSYKNKTIEVGNLLNNHIYWTNFFSWLERNTLNTVSYSGFSGKLDGKYFLAGEAGSFADVSWQVKTLLDDPITVKAKVGSISSSELQTKAEKAAATTTVPANLADEQKEIILPLVSFSLDLEIKPEIFKK